MIGIVHRPPCTWTKEHSQSPTACSSWTTPRCSRTTTTTLRLHGGRAARRAAPAELFHPTSRSPLVCDATCDVDPEKQDPQVRNSARGRLPPRARTRTRSRTSGKQDAELARCADDRFASMRRNHAERHGDGAPAATPAARSRPRARTELRAPSSCTVPLYCFTKRTSRTFIFYPDCENTSVVTCRYL